jgi:hypothetical protein
MIIFYDVITINQYLFVIIKQLFRIFHLKIDRLILFYFFGTSKYPEVWGK